MDKHLYKVTLNWYGEIHIFYSHATASNRALNFSIRRLAKELGVTYGYVKRKFIGEKDNFKVERR